MRVLLLLTILTIPPAAWAEPLRVAVAANFRATLELVNERYLDQGGGAVVISSASTGVLTTQAMHGAPYHLFLAADSAGPELLHKKGLGKTPFCYARGALALLGGMLEDLANGDLSLAIANPDTAPYGRAALAVIDRPEFAPGDQRKLVRGSNVLQAYQYWRSGTVDLALVARSLASSGGQAVPENWHPALIQSATVLRPHPELDAYLAHLRSDRVRSLILDAGYLTCP